MWSDRSRTNFALPTVCNLVVMLSVRLRLKVLMMAMVRVWLRVRVRLMRG